MPRQADRPLGALPTSVTTWFASQDAEPGLLSNRAVRTHLEPYSPHVWPQVTRLTLLYGIAALRKAYAPGQLSLGDLADVVARAQVAVTVEEGLPELLSKVDTFQSDVAAISAGLRQPVGGAQGGAPAAGLATRKGFEPSLAPAGAASRPADRQRAGLASRTAVKPSSSWRLGDVAPLAVGEPLDDGLEPRVPSPPPPPQRTAVSAAGSLPGRNGSAAAVLKPSATWRAGDPLSRPDRVHRAAASAEAVNAALHDPSGAMNGESAAPQGSHRPGYPTWWPAVTSASPARQQHGAAPRKPGGKKQPSAEQLAFEAALYARSREVAAQRAEAAAAAAAAAGGVEGVEYRAPRRSVAFEVPLKPGAPPVLLRASDDVFQAAPGGVADISVFDLVRPHVLAHDAAPSAPPAPSSMAAAAPSTSANGGANIAGGIPAHVAALRKAEAEYQQLLAEARDADAAAAQARAAAASAMSVAHGGVSAGQAALDDLLSQPATSAPQGGPRAVADDFFSGPWTRDLLAPPPVPGASKPQRKSWAQTFPVHGGDASGVGSAVDAATMMARASASAVPLAPRTSAGLNIMADTAAPLPLTHAAPQQQHGAAAASLKAAKWTPADDLAFSDSDSDGGASADSAALAAVLRAARTAAAAAGEAAALTAKSQGVQVTYGATDVGGPAYTQQQQQQGGGLDAHLAAWRATASPQRTDVSGPLRALLDTWRAGQGTTADGWALEDDGLSSSAESP